jgi:hypothetical protein
MKNYQPNAEAIIDDIENQIKVIQRLNERSSLDQEDLKKRLELLIKDLDRVKFFLSL